MSTAGISKGTGRIARSPRNRIFAETKSDDLERCSHSVQRGRVRLVSGFKGSTSNAGGGTDRDGVPAAASRAPSAPFLSLIEAAHALKRQTSGTGCAQTFMNLQESRLRVALPNIEASHHLVNGS